MSLRDAVQRIIKQGDDLRSKRSGLLSIWQDVAEHFYPERADFTTIRRGAGKLKAFVATLGYSPMLLN